MGGDAENTKMQSPHFLTSALLRLLGVFLVGTGVCHAWHFVPPAGSGVANVKDYGAKGDGKTDDTQAILEAISDNIDKARYRANPFIWFPDGTYLVSDSIEGRAIGKPGERAANKTWSAGWLSMMILIGETREGVVIKLKDKAPGFMDVANPKWLIATGSENEKRSNQAGGGNRAFRHNILNLTVDVGSGNPGAIGIDFVANNRGSIDGVTIRAGENSGKTAINLTRNWPGPAMVLDVAIEGFDHAIELGHYQYGMTFENIRMRGQRKTAIINFGNVVTMRNLDFEGSALFYESEKSRSSIALLDSKLKNIGNASTAMITSGFVNLRRTEFSGYATILDGTSAANQDLVSANGEPTVIEAHDQGLTFNTGSGPATPLNLSIAEIPTIRPPDGAEWMDGGESAESLQAAIDAGAEYIFIKPVVTVNFDKPVILRNKVKLIMGMHGSIVGPGAKETPYDDRPPAFVMAETGAETVCLEQIHISGRVENPSARILVLRHVDIERSGLLAMGSGTTHVIDVMGRNYRIGPQHKFYARQLNAEFGSDPLFTNSGTSWIMGFKMESSSSGSKSAPDSTPSIYNLDGKLEVFGGFLYTLGSNKAAAPKVPAFTNRKGKIAISYRLNGNPDTYYPIILRQGTLEKGTDILAKEIKGPGAALFTDER